MTTDISSHINSLSREKDIKKEKRQSADFRRKPDWLKIKLPKGFKAQQVLGLLNEKGIHTICSSGMCPNRAECWGAGTATFMIGGNICTRNCRFCNVTSGRPLPLDEKEISNITDSIKSLNLRHVVITSVDRDDLEDYGAGHWVKMINAIHKECPGVTMEVLIPDFKGREDLLDMIIETHPDIVSHNLETVRRLTPEVRTFATYDNSLHVLEYLAKNGVTTKSGIMLGLGETEGEILATMDDLISVDCKIMTIGQYLQPTKDNFQVKEYIHPDKFCEYRRIGKEKGFRHIESGSMVRSSYHAERHIL